MHYLATLPFRIGRRRHRVVVSFQWACHMGELSCFYLDLLKPLLFVSICWYRFAHHFRQPGRRIAFVLAISTTTVSRTHEEECQPKERFIRDSWNICNQDGSYKKFMNRTNNGLERYIKHFNGLFPKHNPSLIEFTLPVLLSRLKCNLALQFLPRRHRQSMKRSFGWHSSSCTRNSCRWFGEDKWYSSSLETNDDMTTPNTKW